MGSFRHILGANYTRKMSTKYKDLSRALIKKFELLPNVFEFSVEKYSVHEFAAIYGIEKILRRTHVEKLIVSKPNKYLTRQYERLTYYAANDMTCEYNYLSEVIIRKSKSFRILSLNRTIADWFIKPVRELRRIWRELGYISSTLSTDLQSKRTWIDKKPGDYGRPLTVPTPAWRCFSFMRMDHFERFFKASGRLQAWQHGGRSGVGVMSAYKSLIPRIKTSRYIYEFDIKGFFDNISHQAIIQRFKETLGIKTSLWVANILKAQPQSYVMPPLDDDIAYQEIMKHSNKFVTDLEPLDEPYFAFPSDDFRIITEEERIREGLPAPEFNPWPYSLEPYYEDGEIKIKVEMGGDLGSELDREEISFETSYKDAMEGRLRVAPITNPLWQFPVEKFEEAKREKGRDAWKNLGQPGKGVPQGLNTSPFMSTILTDTYLYQLGTEEKALLMYMDDGILFADNKQDMDRAKKLLAVGLHGLGLEVAAEKSGDVKIDGKWLKNLKFLGLSYLHEEDTLMSDTRSGTKVKFPMVEDWDNISKLAKENNLSNPYMRKLFSKLINTQAYEAGLKYGFLGCLIAGSQYKEAKTMLERKEDIQVGQNTAWNKIQNSQGFIWKHQDLMNYPETLTNISSIASHRFAEFNRKGYKLFIPRGRFNKVKRI